MQNCHHKFDTAQSVKLGICTRIIANLGSSSNRRSSLLCQAIQIRSHSMNINRLKLNLAKDWSLKILVKFNNNSSSRLNNQDIKRKVPGSKDKTWILRPITCAKPVRIMIKVAFGMIGSKRSEMIWITIANRGPIGSQRSVYLVYLRTVIIIKSCS